MTSMPDWVERTLPSYLDQPVPPEPANDSFRLHCTCHGLEWVRTYTSPAGRWIKADDQLGRTYSWTFLVTRHPGLKEGSRPEVWGQGPEAGSEDGSWSRHL